jgi:hypothetical protein
MEMDRQRLQMKLARVSATFRETLWSRYTEAHRRLEGALLRAQSITWRQHRHAGLGRGLALSTRLRRARRAVSLARARYRALLRDVTRAALVRAEA